MDANKPTEPELHITPWLIQSFELVDKACDRWLRRRAQLRRRKDEIRRNHPSNDPLRDAADFLDGNL
jgi:hypothetical protein